MKKVSRILSKKMILFGMACNSAVTISFAGISMVWAMIKGVPREEPFFIRLLQKVYTMPCMEFVLSGMQKEHVLYQYDDPLAHLTLLGKILVLFHAYGNPFVHFFSPKNQQYDELVMRENNSDFPKLKEFADGERRKEWGNAMPFLFYHMARFFKGETISESSTYNYSIVIPLFMDFFSKQFVRSVKKRGSSVNSIELNDLYKKTIESGIRKFLESVIGIAMNAVIASDGPLSRYRSCNSSWWYYSVSALYDNFDKGYVRSIFIKIVAKRFLEELTKDNKFYSNVLSVLNQESTFREFIPVLFPEESTLFSLKGSDFFITLVKEEPNREVIKNVGKSIDYIEEIPLETNRVSNSNYIKKCKRRALGKGPFLGTDINFYLADDDKKDYGDEYAAYAAEYKAYADKYEKYIKGEGPCPEINMVMDNREHFFSKAFPNGPGLIFSYGKGWSDILAVFFDEIKRIDNIKKINEVEKN